MKRAGRQVLLLLDNAPSHQKKIQLTNVKMVFLTANTTSRLQPLDQGIIAAIQQLYKKSIVLSVLSKIDKGASITAAALSKTVAVLNAIQWVSSVIKEIKGEPVRKCFTRCGLGEHSHDTEFEDDDVPIAQLVELFRTAQKKVIIDDPRGVYAGR